MRKDDGQISKAKYEVAQERLVESGTDSIATVAHTANVFWSEVALLVGLA
jgi:dihydrodipicolinate synthase/N-acetylneuraminate lyase